MSTPVTITTQSFPDDYCFKTIQQLALDIAARLSGSIAGSASLYTIGKSTPSTANEDRPWLKLNSDGSPNRLYVYWQGLWVAEHPVPPSSAERRIWTDTEDALKTYDGGQDVALSPLTGPMWQVDSDFAARFPAGVGTTPNNTPIEISGGNRTGGEDEHTLTIAEMPAHTHEASNASGGDSGDSTTDFSVRGQTGSTGGDEPHNNLPPYIGVYFIKRTIRQFYVAS